MVSVSFVLRVSIPRVKKNIADENQAAAAAVIPDVSLFFFFFLTLCRETAALENDWVFFIVHFDRLPC